MDDIHFLERLERVSMVHMDLALGLYRNPELVSFILRAAAPPDRFERVAIALDHSPNPPWVLVDRQGTFITCLAAGMVPTGCWTIRRGRLDQLARKHERLGHAIAKLEALVADKRSFVRLWGAVLGDAHLVSREQMAELLPVANLLNQSVTKALVAAIERRERLLREGSRLLARRHRLNAREADTLQALWSTDWSIGHLSVLLGAAERDTLEVRVRRDEASMERLIGILMRGGLWPTALRACWLAARMPWRGLRPLSAVTEATVDEHPEGVSHALALAFFATRVGPGRPDALATLERVAALRTTGINAERRRNGAFAESLARALRSSDAAAPPRPAPVDDSDHALLTFWRLSHPPGARSPVTGDDAEDRRLSQTPEGKAAARRARARWANEPVCVYGDPTLAATLPGALGWAARAAPRNLYLPEAELDEHAQPWHPELAMPWLSGAHEIYGGLGREPRRREQPKVGRNAPCPCGSGHKHKRCCGA